MVLKSVIQAGAIVALVGSLTGGVWALDERFASRKMVASISQQILLIKIENALAAGAAKKDLLRRLCDDFAAANKWVPSGCRK